MATVTATATASKGRIALTLTLDIRLALALALVLGIKYQTLGQVCVEEIALRQPSLLYYNSLVILVSCYSVIAIGVDIIIVIVVVVNFRCPPVAIKSWQHNVTQVIDVYDSNLNKVHVTWQEYFNGKRLSKNTLVPILKGLPYFIDSTQ